MSSDNTAHVVEVGCVNCVNVICCPCCLFWEGLCNLVCFLFFWLLVPGIIFLVLRFLVYPTLDSGSFGTLILYVLIIYYLICAGFCCLDICCTLLCDCVMLCYACCMCIACCGALLMLVVALLSN